MKTRLMDYQYESPAVYMTQSLSARESCWTVPSAKVWQLLDPLVSFALGWCTTVLSSAVSWALLILTASAWIRQLFMSPALLITLMHWHHHAIVSLAQCWHHINARARSSKYKGLNHHYSSPTHHYSSPTHPTLTDRHTCLMFIVTQKSPKWNLTYVHV